ncbi:MAG: hypothetical protein R3D68_17530 [Hyphomicrobiaceae bacterium]
MPKRNPPQRIGLAGHMCPLRAMPCLPAPERLVALGFRYWMQGRVTGDIACWERAWQLYSGVLGVAGAKLAVGCLSGWVRSVSDTAIRDIEVLPTGCGGFCRDECIAVSMIAACQHRACPAQRACAFALAECSLIDGVVGAAQEFADTMTGLEQVLSPNSIVPAPGGGGVLSSYLQ